ncbi:MAG: hypothetical protein GY834_09215 [Bacteroidetes bacterium]|nr:hypothetical protein [Bacteroidota bacterium]
MRLKCLRCGSEDVTIMVNPFYQDYKGMPWIKSVGYRCWNCEAYTKFLDRWWIDENTPTEASKKKPLGWSE